MMQALYDKRRIRTDTYRYQVNEGGELSLRVGSGEKEIEIVFENGKYSRCAFHFRGPYTRGHWHVLHGIAEEISRLEAEYKNEAAKQF